MNLALDFGNTRIKTAVFDGDKLVRTDVFNTETELISALDAFSQIDHCIIGSVTSAHETIYTKLKERFHTLLFETTTAIPLTNKYKSALTLGSDRIAASIGSYSMFPNKNVLTIDAGTCIKYNFVNSNNEYIGGAISPGLSMRLKAMHHYTHALPEVALDFNYKKLIGQNTSESMLSGALVAAAAEIDGIINKYKESYPDVEVVITGGDSEYLSEQLKNRFFAGQYILLQGLNTILNYNLEK